MFPPDVSAKAHRLPTSVVPTAYDVDITTAPERDRFEGRVTMKLDVREATTFVEMHARELELSEATISIGGEHRPAKIELNAERQTVRFSTGATLEVGATELCVTFVGEPNPSMHGLYVATDGSSKAICTQCEATDARAIFPCFDEPMFKATLRWTIRTEPGLVALANGPLEREQTEGEVVVHEFSASKPVSSYLAALTVGDFESPETTTVNGIPLRVYGTTGKGDQTPFALDYTAKLLPWYESYFDIAYPFAKYDQVAVPGFDAGAMENVGLVLFRQNLLLMDPATVSWRQKKLIAKVIAHEIAHMWFGNLVTMKWWDDLWLNEAFAEWMAHKACDAVSPDYKVWDDFQEDKGRALADDALSTTHPIYTSVETPEQALEMFDVITYQKGCAVMRMLENYLGEEPFREGLRAYMREFEYGNAAGPDLWRALETASGQPVGALMNSWINVPGFPVLSASLEGSELTVSQRRFFSSATAEPEAEPTVWNVPVVVRFEDDDGVKEHRFILDSATQTAALPANGAVKWCYPNASEIGFYRTQPDAKLRASLAGGGLGELDPIEQRGLLQDQWGLVRNGTESVDGFLDLVDACMVGKNPPIADHNVLRAVVTRLGTVDRILRDADDEAALTKMQAWIADRLTGPLAALGMEPKDGEAQNDSQRRALLIHAMARLARAPTTIDAAIHYAEKERADPSSVDANLAGTFLDVAARTGDAERYDLWQQTYADRKAAGLPPQACLRYLYTLAAFEPEPLTERTLQGIGEGVTPQEAVGPLLSQLLGERKAQMLAWSFVKSSWEELRHRVGDMQISRVVEAVGALRGEHREDVVAFFEANPPVGAERALARALEFMDEAEALRGRITPDLVRWFANRD